MIKLNGFDKANLEGIASFLALYRPCNICEYQSTNKCESITHEQNYCTEGIKIFLEKKGVEI